MTSPRITDLIQVVPLPVEEDITTTIGWDEESRPYRNFVPPDLQDVIGMPNNQVTRNIVTERLRAGITRNLEVGEIGNYYSPTTGRIPMTPPTTTNGGFTRDYDRDVFSPFLDPVHLGRNPALATGIGFNSNVTNNGREAMAETATTVDPTVQPVIPIPLEGKCNVDYSTLPAPKYMKEELVYLAGYFIVQSEDGTFGYYTIKYHAGKQGNFYRIRTSPPFLVNGMVCIEDAFISVPISDLVRKHVNTTRVISKRNTKTGSAKSAKAAIGSERDSDESGFITVDGVEIDKAIDLVMQEQADALLHLEDSKEEW